MAGRRKRDFHVEQMKFLLDMNLPPRWAQFFSDHGFKCVHWSNVGEYTAKDSVIMAYALEHGYTVLTHDLDFGALLAAALRDGEEAKRVIDAMPKRHPFEMRYDRIENVDWESCSRILDSASQLEALRKGW
jgi:Domain of unknown function (DUF5615)